MIALLMIVIKLDLQQVYAASWLSPLGPMTFIFSTNLSKANTDKTESFNFNLGTTFNANYKKNLIDYINNFFNRKKFKC